MNRQLIIATLTFGLLVQTANASEFELINPFDTMFLTDEQWAELEETELTIDQWQDYRKRLENDVIEARKRVTEAKKLPNLETAQKEAKKLVSKGIKDIAKHSWTVDGRVKGGLKAARRLTKFLVVDGEVIKNLDGVQLAKAEEELDKAKNNYNLATSYIKTLKEERQRIIDKSDASFEEIKSKLSEAISEVYQERRRVETSRNEQLRQQAPRLKQAVEKQRQRQKAEREQRRILQFQKQVNQWVTRQAGPPKFSAPGGVSGNHSGDNFNYPDATIIFNPSDFPPLSPEQIREKLDQ